ncbi:MAG: hypothetical protein ACHWZW_17265 [Spirulina sp.]
MPVLTLDLNTSATLLGTEPALLLKFIEQKALPGVLFFEDQPKLSVFTLADLLNTTPQTLLDWMEDEAFADLIEAVEGDEFYEKAEGMEIYRAFLAEES